ncbi:Hypothetical predicted protein [Cloeon dipterum]|uniref:C-type lectin domain-containing protein n=1 Tax=Cloeon dipterum TaxID=197152 RepID=A0A8S1DAY9_9INSE|nr:Hypothetical predicted protein [Cloeon dipterum]
MEKATELKNTTNAEVLSKISSESSPSVTKKTTVGTEVTPDNAAESNLETTPSSFDPTDLDRNNRRSNNSRRGNNHDCNSTSCGFIRKNYNNRVDNNCYTNNNNHTLEGEMVSTGNGKKYFMGSDNNGLTYDVAAAICCKLGMKLAEFATIASWNNFLAYFKLQTFASWDYFGQTRDNGNNTDTWCASGTLVPDGIIPADMYNIPCGTKNLIVLTPGGNLTYINPANYIHRYFCE